jgi:MFS family permease
MGDTSAAPELGDRIRRSRAELDAFLAAAVPRKRRLLNTTILGGSLAAALTAGPAVGGQSFTAWLTATLALESPSWRLLCGVAAACSIAATVATQLLKSHNIEDHVSRAQSCRAKLEVLELSLSLGEIDPRQASAEYLRCVEQTAFLERASPRR